jgi:hypothetical protein
MGTRVSSTLAAAGLIAVLSFAWPLRAAGQGYTGQVRLSTGESINLGQRHSPIPEAGVKICDYWDEHFSTRSDGTWEVRHVRGTIVSKQPRRPAVVVATREHFDNIDNLKKLQASIYFAWVKFRDNNNGSVLRFNLVGEVPPDSIVMQGKWVERSGREGRITCAVYEPGSKRVLLWFAYPESQSYGSAVLYETAQGLSGHYLYEGRTGAWTLTHVRD